MNMVVGAHIGIDMPDANLRSQSWRGPSWAGAHIGIDMPVAKDMCAGLLTYSLSDLSPVSMRRLKVGYIKTASGAHLRSYYIYCHTRSIATASMGNLLMAVIRNMCLNSARVW